MKKIMFITLIMISIFTLISCANEKDNKVNKSSINTTIDTKEKENNNNSSDDMNLDSEFETILKKEKANLFNLKKLDTLLTKEILNSLEFRVKSNALNRYKNKEITSIDRLKEIILKDYKKELKLVIKDVLKEDKIKNLKVDKYYYVNNIKEFNLDKLNPKKIINLNLKNNTNLKDLYVSKIYIQNDYSYELNNSIKNNINTNLKIIKGIRYDKNSNYYCSQYFDIIEFDKLVKLQNNFELIFKTYNIENKIRYKPSITFEITKLNK